MTLTGVAPAALAAALGGSLAAAALSLARRPRAGGRALAVAVVGLTVALVALAVALVSNDGSLVYVADHSSRETSWPYRLAGLWGGMAGSLLLWTWLASVWAVIASGTARRRLRERAAVVEAVLAGELAVLCGLLVAVSRPFDRLAVPAIDGGGLTPVLLHPAMLYHPPLLYAGAVGLAAPFAFAVAGLVSADADRRWLPLAVRAAQVSLVLLTAGLLAGAHWAYVELGWGGYWAWDPVENGGLLAWLAAVAFLHAAVVAGRRDGATRAAAGLAGLAFALGLLGAFLTRSGATQSVHAFAEARAVGRVLLAALAVTVVALTVLLVRHRGRSRSTASPRLVTRPAALAANNLLLVGLVVVIGFGTVFPALARWATGNQVVVTGRYFAVVTVPLVVALLALLGVGPRLRWGPTPPAELRRRLAPAAFGLVPALVAGLWFAGRRPLAVVMVGLAGAAAALTVAGWRRDRRAGWPLAHLGVAVLLAGVAGTTTGASATVSLVPGQSVTVRGWTFRLDDVTPVDAAGATANGGGRAAQARLDVSRRGHTVATLRPVALLSDGGQRVSVAALRSTPLTDVQVAVRAVGAGDRVAVVEIHVLPLMQLVWWGGLLIVAGLVQSGRRAGTTVTGNGDDATNGSVPATTASSTYAPASSRSAVRLGWSGSTIQ